MGENDEPFNSVDDSPSSLSQLAATLSERADFSTDERGDRDKTISDIADALQTEDPGPTREDEELEKWDLVSDQGPWENESDADPKTEAILELIGEESNLLLSGPMGSITEGSLGSRLMSTKENGPLNMIVITISETPGQRLSVLESYLRDSVGESAVIDIQTYNRETNYDQYSGPVDIRQVTSPQNLRRIGILTSKLLSEWEDRAGETTICFYTLSDLIAMNTDRERVFKFLHVLRGRVASAGARAHYHLDPSQHDEQTVHTFESLFDTVIEFEEDGTVSIA